uniref:Uncharacterized protein n=1 Tax=Bradyrhizobium ottawaense TaxID=931866 RepID=A0A2U8P5H6_9BRAD|nr:hypothetical protein CIT37_12245 [Bradyrhizobium ottawaense]
MPGLVPGIHVPSHTSLDVDGRDFNCEDALRALARPRRFFLTRSSSQNLRQPTSAWQPRRRRGRGYRGSN